MFSCSKGRLAPCHELTQQANTLVAAVRWHAQGDWLQDNSGVCKAEQTACTAGCSQNAATAKHDNQGAAATSEFVWVVKHKGGETPTSDSTSALVQFSYIVCWWRNRSPRDEPLAWQSQAEPNLQSQPPAQKRAHTPTPTQKQRVHRHDSSNSTGKCGSCCAGESLQDDTLHVCSCA